MPNESQFAFGAISNIQNNLLGFGLISDNKNNQIQFNHSYEVEFDSAEFDIALIEEGCQPNLYSMDTHVNDLKCL